MELRLEPTPGNVGLGRRALQEYATLAGMDQTRSEEVGLAVTEALTNAFTVQQLADCDTPVQVTAHVLQGMLEVAVVDDGPGFSPPSDAECAEAAAQQTGAVEGGCGIGVMRALTDRIAFSRGSGTTVRMSFDLAP